MRATPGWTTLTAALLSVACAVPAATAQDVAIPACQDGDVDFAQLSAAAAQDALLCAVQEARARNNDKPLARSPLLMDVAQGHAEDMAGRDYLDHVTPEGVGPGPRARRAGYQGSIGEAISGFRTARSTVAAWLRSTRGHRELVLSTIYDDIGVGATFRNGEYRGVLKAGRLTDVARERRDMGCGLNAGNPSLAFCAEYVRSSGTDGVYRFRGEVADATHSSLVTVVVRRGKVRKTFRVPIGADHRFDARVRGPRRPKAGGPIEYRAVLFVDGATKRFSGFL